MIKKSKKIIATLLMTLCLVSIFPMTNAFANADMDFLLKECTQVKDKEGFTVYEKDGKYYQRTEGEDGMSVIARSRFVAGGHYAQSDGSFVKDTWMYSNNEHVWRYLDSDYNSVTGYQTINGVKYYFNKGGDLKIGWYGVGENIWHYSYPDGSIKEGWVQYDGNWYYIYSDGAMAKSTTTPDGYKVNRKGICVS